LIVDVEHDSLNQNARAMRSDAGNAVAHFKLELRADGSLWAVGVVWNSDGETRLRNRTQRYISPAFMTDEDGRIASVLNAALVSMPATYNAPALVAARKTPHDPVTCAAVELCKMIITRNVCRKSRR
jgi:phage I-like protein